MTDSQDWWPADFGHYGACSFAWRGTAPAPTGPGTGVVAAAGANSASRRFALCRTMSAWTGATAAVGPSSRNTAPKISWADLIILTGNVALESMGLRTFGFGGGRADVWEPGSGCVLGAEKVC